MRIGCRHFHGSDPDTVAWLVSPHLVRPTQHVRIAPARLVGEPHLLKTRIGTQSLVSLARDGYEDNSIARLYDIPVEHVKETIAYERRLGA